RKRGRPPGKKNGVMAPPVGPPMSNKKSAEGGKLVQCTRCLKQFNPAWRATPASDPSSEATCAVKHPYKDLPSGLEVLSPARRKARAQQENPVSRMKPALLKRIRTRKTVAGGHWPLLRKCLWKKTRT